MIVTRTAFLRLFSMALVGVRVRPALLASGFRLDRADASHFQPYVGHAFLISPEDGSPRVRVTLTKIVEQPVTNGVAQFILIFHGPVEQQIADGIHDVRHPAFGSLPLFVSSSGLPSARTRAWQACFGRHLRT